ncbi:hypothetical protein [Glycomyces paridis]|uniref:Uncharacterized protein n=1 Tax=Glycomyces paridis TaxID=2126555 RepID=A0A4S8PI50_9ACTN|nr:hypothetical protein [Glycomyces paridis]THV30277.1 hypothetical protein E9998_07910 [Glycomyces paridis]
MSRTVGPYEDVATIRVEGAYELCEGRDQNGRPVQILTLGSTSSKDPARRGLLSDTVAWAYATAGPDDAPIMVADLEAEQPYVVVLHDTRLRGADRIMDRLLALGPATGPLPVGPAAVAQRAAHQLAAAQRSAAPASPAGPGHSSPPPAGPVSAQLSPPVLIIAAPKRRSQLTPILIGIGSVVLILALVVGAWVLWSGTGDDEPPGDSGAESPDNAAVGEVTDAPSDAAEDDGPAEQMPQWDEEAPDERVGGTLFETGDATQTVAYENWPFAFKVPGEYSCEPEGQSAVCTADEGGSEIRIGWETCPGDCSGSAREPLREALPYQPLVEARGGDIAVAERTQVFDRWRGSLSVFVTTADDAFHAWVTADVDADRSEETWQVFNDVLNQAIAKAA